METEEKDESFEIISKKEKHWRIMLEDAEINLFKSEAGIIINKALIDIASEEVEKEAKKNAN